MAAEINTKGKRLMGLDMYAYTTNRQIKSSVDFTVEPADKQLHYWRKHPNLHGWMEGLYRKKGGTQTFNCTSVLLTLEDIDALERAIRAGLLPETCGFFFGASDGSERDDDLEFISHARAELAGGQQVYYTSWW